MAITKQYLKSKPVVKVTFTLPAEAAQGAKTAVIVGDFNAWNGESTPLKKQKDGSFKTTVDLPIGTEVQYRYLLDGSVWENDWAADKYVASGVGQAENSVVVI
jgi:1,4-alpha-glucan branching enzyme